MYHGTRAENGDFTVFDESKARKKGGLGLKAFGKGNYFTAKKLDGSERYGSRVVEAYLNIKKPLIIKRGEQFSEKAAAAIGQDTRGMSSVEVQNAMRDAGYDGVISVDEEGKVQIAVTFDSAQIKSATDNIGTFDASNPDIRYSQRDTEYKTDRQLLASALEGVTKNAEEAQMLREYQEIAAKLDADERRVQEINERIRELRLEDVNTPEEQQLLEERKGLEKGITTADRRLFQMERLQPLQRIAKIQRREAEEALQKARRHLERYKEGVVQREYIGKIKRTSDRLAKWLTKPNNQRYVPEDLRRPLAEFLLAIDRGSETMLTGGGMTQAGFRPQWGSRTTLWYS